MLYVFVPGTIFVSDTIYRRGHPSRGHPSRTWSRTIMPMSGYQLQFLDINHNL